MSVVTLACLSARITMTVQAQNYSPIVEDRVETGIVQEFPVIPEETEVPGGLEIGAVISTAYDSNIYLSRTNPESDTVTRFGPGISYTQGNATEGEGGFIKLAYQPTGVFYSRNPSENRVDHVAALTAGWRGKQSSITYVGAARKLGDATAETGSQTDRLELENEIRVAWMPREKITVELAAGSLKSEYADPALFDSSETYAKLGLRYAYSPKTEIGVAYQAGRLEVDGGSNQTLQQLTLSLAWQPRQKIMVNLQAGVEHRDAQSGSSVNPVIDGRIAWKPRDGTELYLSGYQRQEASAYYAGQDYEVLGATAGVSQRLGGNWTGRLDVGREKVTYSRVSGFGTSGRKDSIWFVRPALEYKFTDALGFSVFYKISDDSSTARDFGYRQKLAGIELNYKF